MREGMSYQELENTIDQHSGFQLHKSDSLEEIAGQDPVFRNPVPDINLSTYCLACEKVGTGARVRKGLQSSPSGSYFPP